MKSLLLASLALSSTLLATTGDAAAQPTESTVVETAPAARVHSINVSPLGLVGGGGFNINYERLFSGSHGLVIEVGSTQWHGSSTTTVNGRVTESESIDARHATVGVGYRWHWRGRQNSGFLGVMLHQNLGMATVDVMDDGERATEDVAYRSTTLTANIGKRWVFRDAFNVTLRLGVGAADREVIDQDADPMAAQTLQDHIDIPLAVDGELSLGYTF